MADVKVQTPAKDNRAGAGGAQGGQKTPMNIKENNNNTPVGNKSNKGNNNNSDSKLNNSAGKKRKMNHNGPPHHQNQNQNGGERGDRSGGGVGSAVWNPGPGGPQPFQTHRLTGAPAWDLPPQNAMSQTFTGMLCLFIHRVQIIDFFQIIRSMSSICCQSSQQCHRRHTAKDLF